jgi:excisionase family DNA binding protein
MATSKTSTPPLPDWWPKHLLDAGEAAELLGMSVPTLKDWRCRKTRSLPYHKLGGSVRYNPSDLWTWLNANAVRPRAIA